MRGIGKRGRQHVAPAGKKTFLPQFNLDAQKFRWSLRLAFWEHGGWKVCAELKYFVENIVDKLQDYETQTWQEVRSAAGGKAAGHGSNSHFIPADKLPRDEKREFIRRGFMDKYDKVFSLRLSGTERLIGVVDGGKFYVLWYDPTHEFFPATK